MMHPIVIFLVKTIITSIMVYSGDMVVEWIAHGTLNAQVMGLNLSAASWLTMCSANIPVVPNLVKKSGVCAVMSL